jgi:Ribosome-binding factor A.
VGAPESLSQRPKLSGILRVDSHTVLEASLARGVVRDYHLRNGEAVSIVDVQLSRDLQIARCFWEPTDMRDSEPEKLQRYLGPASIRPV